MGATLVLMPVAIIGGAVGMAKIKRHKKEMVIQRAMSGCLRERGYEVVSWHKASPHKQHRELNLPESPRPQS